MRAPVYEVVIPTSGRVGLAAVLHGLAIAAGPPPRRVLVVDDRPCAAPPLPLREAARLDWPLDVLRSGGRGPAAARNVGWQAASAPWIAFLDDDVVPSPAWRADLVRDLASLQGRVVGSQGRVRVPLARDRPATDWERNVRGLERARWATADLAYRRDALVAVGGFDERFPRAYREDSDLGLRLARRGLAIVRGTRSVEHPVAPAGAWVSVRKQVGNVDDALMRRLHGRGWRLASGAGPGRISRHAATTLAGATAVGAAALGRRRLAGAAAAGWAIGSGEFALARALPGPRDARELAAMALTSLAIPPAATAMRLCGEIRARRLAAQRGPRPEPPLAVLLDRDGTLVRDVPYNGDPRQVEALPTVADALTRLRARGVRLAIVSNQSGIGRGMLSTEQVAAVTARVGELLGPFDDVRWCPHAPEDGCGCRKPRPGLLLGAAEALGVDPLRCAVIGDIDADVAAARAAGMRAVLVPTPRTRRDEVAAAPERAATLADAAALLLAEAR